MTHSQEQNSEWIEHETTDCPVDGGSLVVIRLRDGTEGPDCGTHAGSLWWGKTLSRAPGEIVAYRLHTPSPSQGDEQ